VRDVGGMRARMKSTESRAAMMRVMKREKGSRKMRRTMSESRQKGDEGTTRRILNSIYSLEERGGRSSDEEDVEEDGSQASLTVSEEAEYRQLLNAWEDVVE